MEAWAPSREECLRQAVLGSVGLFVDIAGALAAGTHAFRVEGDDEHRLVAVLEEIVFLLDTTGAVPVDVAVMSCDGGCDVRFDTVPARTLPRIGAVPKGVSLSQLRFVYIEGGWTCRVTWDV